MNFILQTINGNVTLDMCFQMERAKEYWDWRNQDDTFNLWEISIEGVETTKEDYEEYTLEKFVPEEWCPVGTIEFVEKYLRTYFGNDVADKAMRPLNVPKCFLDNKMNTGRNILNYVLSEALVNSDTYDKDAKYFIKDNKQIKNPLNGIMTLKEAYDKGLQEIQCSQLIKDEHNSSEWRAFIHNGNIVDIKNYSGSPFVFPNINTVINSYMYQLNGTLKEGTLDVYVDEIDSETYVLECHKFFSCGLYGFNQLDILPLMYWRTYKEIIQNV
ncbi:MAG: ATP-grasp domain-containing protein [bacterium]|nr:ATP-grasp domain-containing protein [bacterium]